jgi:hypothetical protein
MQLARCDTSIFFGFYNNYSPLNRTITATDIGSSMIVAHTDNHSSRRAIYCLSLVPFPQTSTSNQLRTVNVADGL